MKKSALFVVVTAILTLAGLWLAFHKQQELAPTPAPKATDLPPASRATQSETGAAPDRLPVKEDDEEGAAPLPSRELLNRIGNDYSSSPGPTLLASTGAIGSVLQFEAGKTRWPVRVEQTQIDGSNAPSVQLMVANRVLVLPTEASTLSDLEALAASLNGRLLSRSAAESGFRVIEFAGHEDPATLPRLIETLTLREHLVAYAEPDYLFRLSRLPNDPEFRRQRALDSPIGTASVADPDINAIEGWDKRVSAQSQVVAVIDSGIQLDNIDLRPNLWTNRREKLDGRDTDNNGYIDDLHGVDLVAPNTEPNDTSGHGTAVAALIGARGDNGHAIAGVAWSVQLMAIQIFDDSGYATASDAASGIEYAIKNGAKIINASWSGEGDSLALKLAIQKANTAGVLFVAAAGNEGIDLDTTPMYPASYDLPNLIAVAAIDHYGERPAFSNWGVRSVHIAAMGERVLSLSIEPSKSVDTFSGTSFSAPIVAGIAALAREEFGPEPPATLRRRILASARVSPERRLDWVFSQGLADLARVLNEVKPEPGNDNRAKAHELSRLADRHISHALHATTEAGETLPDAAGGWKTVWYSIAPEHPKPFIIRVTDYNQNATVRFYGGADMSPVDPIETGGFGYFKLGPVVEQTLFVQVASQSELWFEIKLEAEPLNDDFAGATTLTAEPFVDATSNLYATVETNEPFAYQGAPNSVWWKYTPTETGTFLFSTEGSETDTLLRVFAGDQLTSLSLAGYNDNANHKAIHSELAIDLISGVTYYLQVKSAYNAGGRVSLRGQLLRVPTFVTIPSSLELPFGSQAVLRGSAIGPSPIAYQWLLDGEPISGATSNSLIIESIDASHVGVYTLKATSPGREATTPPARLSLLGRSPQFALHPASGDYRSGDSVTLFAVLTDETDAIFQWYKDDQPIVGETASSLVLSRADPTKSGVYTVRAENTFGATFSKQATLYFGEDRDLLLRPAFEDERFRLIGMVEVDGRTMWFASRDSELWRSTNGFDWEEVKLSIDASSNFGPIERVEFGNGIYFVGSSSSWAVGSSFDSLVWVSHSSIRSSVNPQYVKFIDGYFYGHTSHASVRSLDGVIWHDTNSAVPLPKDIVPLRPGGPYAVMQSDRMLYSKNMTTWLESNFPASLNATWPTLISDGERFIVFLRVHPEEENRAYASVNGIDWTQLSTPPIGEGSVHTAVFADGRYILLTRDGLLVSRDITTWEEIPMDTSFIQTLAYSDGLLFADGSTISPTRLLSAAPILPTPPIVLPIEMKPSYRTAPGSKLFFSVEARGIDSPLARVEFRRNGTVRRTMTAAPFEFSWTAEGIGVHSIEAVAYDQNGNASRIGTMVTVIANQIVPARGGEYLSGIRFMADAFGSTFAGNGASALFRFTENANWLLCHTFPEPAMAALFSFREELYVAAGDKLYRSKDGMNWELALRNVRDAKFYPGESWLIVAKMELYTLHARYSVDGEAWFESRSPNVGEIGVLGGNIVCSVPGTREQVGLLAPGKELEAFDLPSGTSLNQAFVDGSWLYAGNLGYAPDGIVHEPKLYKTRTFSEWEEVLGPARSMTDYANGLYRGALHTFSKDQRNWIDFKTHFDDALEVEQGFTVASQGNLYHSLDGSNWTTALTGYADTLRKTLSGYFAWSSHLQDSGVYFSTDGISWTTLHEENYEQSGYYEDIAYGDGTYVAVGNGKAYSYDGDVWNRLPAGLELGSRVVFGNGRFLATSSIFDQTKVAASADGVNWSFFSVLDYHSADVALSYLPEAKLFVLYEPHQRRLLKSSNGETWEEAVDRPIFWAKLLDNHLYIHFEGEATWSFTRDLSSWTATSHAARAFINGDFYADNLISSDGVNWRQLDFIHDFSYNKRILPLSDGSVLMETGTKVDGVAVLGKARHGEFEGWMTYAIAARPIKFVNGHSFVLGFGINRFTTDDLQLVSVSLNSDADGLRVGDKLALSLRVRNRGLDEVNLEGVSLQTRLAADAAWTEEGGYALTEVELPRVFVPAGGEREVKVLVSVPSGVRPGVYSLLALVNPHLSILDSSLSNNYAIETEKRVTVASGSLSVQVVGSGEVTLSPQRDHYALGDTVLIRALPHPKHRLKQASGSTLQRQNLYAVVVEAVTQPRFEFEEAWYTVQVEAIGKGSVFASPSQHSYLEGEYVTLTAFPEAGARFSGWNGSFQSALSEVTVPVLNNIVATAVFGTTYQSWVDERYSEAQLADETVVGKLRDSDGDGMGNLWEYLVGTDPTNPASASLLACALEGDFLVLRFHYSRSTLDYEIRIQSSTDGIVWRDLDPRQESRLVIGELVSVERSVPMTAEPTLLYRLAARPAID